LILPQGDGVSHHADPSSVSYTMHYLQRRAILMQRRSIDVVLDVGANKGQFGKQLRGLGYRGRIISFEPLSDAFSVLSQTASGDPMWTCHNFALGDLASLATINVSANSHSSSLLPASARSLQIEPSIKFIRTEKIRIRRLDDLLPTIVQPGNCIFLKIDTQGYETKVIEGARGVIERFALIQLEVSFFPVYEGETLAGDVINLLDSLGYRIVSFEPGWEDGATAELLQVDLVFAKK
jgi:FkbM family methyltransferase